MAGEAVDWNTGSHLEQMVHAMERQLDRQTTAIEGLSRGLSELREEVRGLRSQLDGAAGTHGLTTRIAVLTAEVEELRSECTEIKADRKRLVFGLWGAMLSAATALLLMLAKFAIEG